MPSAFYNQFSVAVIDADGIRVRLEEEEFNIDLVGGGSLGTVESDEFGVVQDAELDDVSPGDVIEFSHATLPGTFRRVVAASVAEAEALPENNVGTFIVEDLAQVTPDAMDIWLERLDDPDSEDVYFGRMPVDGVTGRTYHYETALLASNLRMYGNPVYNGAVKHLRHREGVTSDVAISTTIPEGSYVTSVALSMPSLFSVSGSPSGGPAASLSVTLAVQNQKKFFAGPASGADAAPTFRAIEADDIIEAVGDVVGNSLVFDTGTIDWTYDDLEGTLSAEVKDNSITLAKMATMATASFLGRNTAGTGNVEVLSASTVRTMLSINNVENTALSTWAGSTNITTLGTISTGTWNGSTIDAAHGGTGRTSHTAYAVICGGTSSTNPQQNVSGLGSAGQILTSNGAGALPTWQDAAAPSFGAQSAKTFFAGPTSGSAATPAFRAIEADDIIEAVGDVVGNSLLYSISGTIDLTYDDLEGTLSLDVADNAITLAKLATQAANTILANVTGSDAVPTAVAIAANQFLARSSAGNMAAKSITDAAFDLLDDSSASNMLTTLGGTTVGKAIFGLTNPSAVTFIRMNADNTVTARTASEIRTDLGLVIGTNVQAYDADLTTWAGLTPSANAQSLVTAADYAAMRALLDLEPNTDFYAPGGTDVPVADGGTGRSSHTAYAVICGGTSSTNAQQSVASLGTAGQVLTSQGAGALPTWTSAGSGTVMGTGTPFYITMWDGVAEDTIVDSPLSYNSGLDAFDFGNKTIGSASWGGDVIPITHGGTGSSIAADAFAALSPATTRYDLIVRGSTSWHNALPANVTTAGQFLYSIGNGSSTTTFGWRTFDFSTDGTGDLPFSRLAQGSALSVLGVTGNATADVASIAAGSDHQVLRRNGTALAFGAVNLASSNAVTGTLPVANGGTAASSFGTSNGVVHYNGSALVTTAGFTFASSNLTVPKVTIASNSQGLVLGASGALSVYEDDSDTNGAQFTLQTSRGYVLSRWISSATTVRLLAYNTAGEAYFQTGLTGGSNAGKWHFSGVNGNDAAYVHFLATYAYVKNNLGVGVTAFGTSAAKVLGIGNGTVPSTSPADMIQIFSVDASAGNATLGLRTEAAVATESVVSDRTLQVVINGTVYKLCLKA